MGNTMTTTPQHVTEPGRDALANSARDHLWMHFTRHSTYYDGGHVPVIVKGEGSYIWDDHGNKYFDGLSCHRIIPKFVAQCGDPTGNGTGGPGYKIIDELPKGSYKVGSLAMANSGPNTNGSQFFVITGADGAALPAKYSLFGMVVGSDATIKALDAAGNPSNNGMPPKQAVTITSVVIAES